MRVILLMTAMWTFPFLSFGGPCLTCFDVEDPSQGPGFGFWDERNISASAGMSCDPDIAVEMSPLPDDSGPVLIVWSDDTADPPAVNPERDREVWLALSTDGGCGFSKYQLTNNDGDDDKPAVCLNIEKDIAVVGFSSRAGVYAVQVSGLSTGPVFSGPEVLDNNPSSSDFRNVDVACAPQGDSDVYATWDALVSDGPSPHREVFFKRNRMTGAPGAWEGSDGGPNETSLTAGLSGSNSNEASITSDLFSSAPGESSLSVFFVNDGNCGVSSSCVMFLRSRDGGGTFWGDPLGGSQAPVVISDIDKAVGTSKVRASSSPFASPGATPQWYASVWVTSDGEMSMDTQAEDISSYDEVWNVPPATDIRMPSAMGMKITDAAMAFEAVHPDRDTTEWMWSATGPTGSEIFFDVGILWLPGHGYDKFMPFCANGPLRVTGLFPARTDGGADSVSLGAANTGMFMAFRDDRGGDSEIYFKRSDVRSRPGEVSNVTATPLSCPDVGFTLDWDHPAQCPTVHYRVYLGGGPFPLVDVTGPPVVIKDLDAYGTYSYHVTAVNEACNEGAYTENSIQMGTCDYVLRSRFTYFKDHCPFGYGDANYNPEPGENLSDVWIQLDNYGRNMATNCTATLVSRMPEVTVVPPATSRYPDIGSSVVGNDTPFELGLGLDFQCGGLKLELDFVCDQGAFTVPVNRWTPTTPCEVCKGCDALPGEIVNLQEVKNGSDIEMSWNRDPLALNGYNVWSVSNKADVPRATMANRSPTGPANGVSGCAAPGPALAESCLLAGGVSDPAPLLFFQVKGFCAGQEGP